MSLWVGYNMWNRQTDRQTDLPLVPCYEPGSQVQHVTHTYIQTDTRQTDILTTSPLLWACESGTCDTDRQTDRQIDRQTDRRTYHLSLAMSLWVGYNMWHTDRQTDRLTTSPLLWAWESGTTCDTYTPTPCSKPTSIQHKILSYYLKLKGGGCVGYWSGGGVERL